MIHKHYFLKGLPASGKSTFCSDLLKRYPNVYFRVNKDDLRTAFYKDNFTKVNEEYLLQTEEFLITQAIEQGKYILWDNTHLAPKHTERKKRLEEKFNIVFEEKFFMVDLQEAIMRDSLRSKPVGAKVITDMYNTFLKNSNSRKIEYAEYIDYLSFAYIFDMDGTLAWNNGRSWYDWQSVDTDLPNPPVVDLAKTLAQFGKIIIVSGRDEESKEKTEKWLIENGVPFYGIFMRARGDNRSDEIVKEEIFETYIKGKFNIKGVFDDRLSVCKLWHKLNLPLFRVGDPTADF